MFDHIKEFLFAPSIRDGRRSVRLMPEVYNTGIKKRVAALAPLLAFGVFGGLSAAGATNEWTKPSSGYWEESYWSLGRLPLDQDTVAFRNSNWKALAIGANTTANYPGSLSINNLLVGAPTYSFNQLLLNWAGFTVPLNVRSNLTIGVNGSLASHYSALHAANFEINGPTSFSDAAVGVFNQIVVGHLAAAEMDLQGGSISCGRFVLSSGAPGSYKQSGGTLNTTNIEIGGNGSFKLLGGAVSNAGLFIVSGPSSVFVAVAACQRLGKLQITNAPASASLDLEPVSGSNGPALLRFEDSRNICWSGSLRILNWSTNHLGHGPDHIFVGTNSQGLTSDQLSRMTFVHPDGSPSNYWAAIRSNGEVVPGAAQGQEFRYITNNSTISITGYTGPEGDVTIPSVITGLPVTSIWDWAFGNSTILTSVTIPSSVTNIGTYAFTDSTSLTTITVNPDNPVYSSVGGVLFNKNRTKLIICPGGKAGNYTLPNTVATIGDWAFYYCTNLASVTIPNNVNRIGYSAFFGCSGLTNAVIGNGVTRIGDYAFYICSSLTSVSIPTSVTSFGEGAFGLCTSLPCVTIPNSVTEIGDYAFSDCRSLTNITIPNSVVSIGNYAFSDCDSSTSVSIPNSVTNIGNYAFYECSGLNSVTIPNSVMSIGDYEFGSCFGLTNVIIGNGVTTIGSSAFSYCWSLPGITIPNSVTTIGNFAFDLCYGLISVNIGNSVSSIGNYAFNQCTSLTAITVDPNNSFYSSLGSCSTKPKRRSSCVLRPNPEASPSPTASPASETKRSLIAGAWPAS